MARVAPLLAAVLSSWLLIRTPAEASIFCARRKVLSASGVQYTFLRSIPRPAPPSLRLYLGSWSHGRALLSCAWSDHAAATRDYLTVCQERAGEFSDRLEEGLHVGSMFGAEDPCVSLASPAHLGVRAEEWPRRSAGHAVGSSAPGMREEGSEGRSLRRTKRGFIVPGTLWCGSGNKAPSFGDLGLFADTDSCCREHDQCKSTIPSFHSQFGVFNSNIFTMSHCDCDRKFRRCLLEAGDGISGAVGYTFFNLLKMHCFELSHRLRCTQRNWFGRCKESKVTLYAEVHPPTPYEAPAQLNTSATGPEEPLQNSTTGPPVPSAAGVLPTPWTGAAPASITEAAAAAAALSGLGWSARAAPGPERPSPARNQPASGLRGLQQACWVYRDLDECRTKIPPRRERFGLRNTNATTLYPCDCTGRLFQMWANQTQVAEVHAALLGRVSLSCFLWQNCTAGKICATLQLTAQLPEPHRSTADAGKQRHLLAASAKARRPKGGERAAKLYNVCLRMVRKLAGSAGGQRKSRKADKSPQQRAVHQ